jgi:transposase
MIQITAQMRVLVAIEPVDGRKGIDSLARLCQEKLAEDPFSGCVFVWWPEAAEPAKLLEAYEAQLLMAAGDVSRVRAAPMWRRVTARK